MDRAPEPLRHGPLARRPEGPRRPRNDGVEAAPPVLRQPRRGEAPRRSTQPGVRRPGPPPGHLSVRGLRAGIQAAGEEGDPVTEDIPTPREMTHRLVEASRAVEEAHG